MTYNSLRGNKLYEKKRTDGMIWLWKT